VSLFARTYGYAGPLVIVLHGGPGAPGQMAPVARGLAGRFRVVEPFQRNTTVAGHVADLREIVEPGAALVGSSWGAMLALAFSAEHAEAAGPIVLIGCGTFDTASRARMQEIVAERTAGMPLPEAPRERARALLPAYSYEPASDDLEIAAFHPRDHQESWADMVRLQEAGAYPAAFRAIRSPVLMLHGAADPHPGRMILDSLRPHIPAIEYREWERCGHYPWLERHAREEFFAVLRDWLTARTAR
jgi:pimeloyl-ACP methyl ester carboxylesterase